MNKFFSSFAIVMTVASVSLAQEPAPVASPEAPAAAPEVTPEDAYQASLLVKPSLALANSEAKASLQQFQLTLNHQQIVEHGLELKKLQDENKALRHDVENLKQEVADVAAKDNFSFISMSAGYMAPVGGDGVSVPYAKVVLEKALGLYGEFLPGYGFGAGLNGVTAKVGRVSLDMLGLGVRVYSDDNKPLTLRQDPRTVDMVIKPLEVSAQLYNTKAVSIGLTGFLSFDVAGPTVWYDRADKVINSSTGSSTTNSMVIPTTVSADNLNGASNLVQEQVNSKTAEVKDKTEQALTEAGKAMEDGFKHPYIGVGIIVRL